MSAFFEMGGHAAYIWPCYALAAAVMVYLLVGSVSAMRRNEAMAKALDVSRRPRSEGEANTRIAGGSADA